VMEKPAFVFDGRLILDHQYLREIGFIVYALGRGLHSCTFQLNLSRV